MLPQMLAIPSVRGLVPLPAHASGDVVRGADGEPASGKMPVGGLEFLGRRRGLAPCGKLAGNQIKQRRVALGESGDLRRPVIHLHIDVRVIIAVPGRIVIISP